MSAEKDRLMKELRSARDEMTQATADKEAANEKASHSDKLKDP